MNNEFYCVEYDNCYGGYHYFKDKNKAFNFLWQKFLSIRGNASKEYIQAAFNEMNEFYTIEDFGCVHVCGFED